MSSFRGGSCRMIGYSTLAHTKSITTGLPARIGVDAQNLQNRVLVIDLLHYRAREQRREGPVSLPGPFRWRPNSSLCPISRCRSGRLQVSNSRRRCSPICPMDSSYRSTRWHGTTHKFPIRPIGEATLNWPTCARLIWPTFTH